MMKTFNQHLVVLMLICLLFNCKQQDDEVITEDLPTPPTPVVVQYLEKMKLFSIPELMSKSTNIWAQNATKASNTKEELRDYYLQDIAVYNVFMKDSSIGGKNYFKTIYPENLSWIVSTEEGTVNKWELYDTGIIPARIIEEEKDGSKGLFRSFYTQNKYQNTISWTFTSDNKLIINEEYLEQAFRYQTIYAVDHSGSFESYRNGKPLSTVLWNADGSGIGYWYTDSVITSTEEWSVGEL